MLLAALLMEILLATTICQTLPTTGSAGEPTARHLPTRFIVKWKVQAAGNEPQEMLKRMRHAARQARYPTLSITAVRYCSYTRQSIVQVSGYNASMTSAELSHLLQTVAQQSGIEYIEEDRVMRHMVTPDDPSYSKQWHYGGVQGAGVYKSGTTFGMNLPGAWEMVKGSAHVVVADVDTGITDHPDLNDMVVPGYDMISDITTANDGDGRDPDPSDPGDASGGDSSSWHGTHVIGTISARTNNGVGVASAGWGVKIQALRALGVGGGYQSDINDAIRWAAGVKVTGTTANKNPSKVINLSLGGSGGCGKADQEAIDVATNAGAILVIAAGNDNTNTNDASPCNCERVICVGAHGPSGQRASYSNYGSEVDIMAPGGDSAAGSDSYMVYSTLNSGTKGPGSPSYGYMEGTSMATPHVSGLVALMASIDPSLVQEEAESILKVTAQPFPLLNGSTNCDATTCGAGLADATAAIQFMQNRPANDRCAAATPLTCGALVQGSTQYATALSKDTACGSNSTTADVWYSLSLPIATTVHFSTCQNATAFNSQVALYSGSCSSLTCIASQNDAPYCSEQVALSHDLPPGTSLIRVSGKGTHRGPFVLEVICTSTAPPPSPAALLPLGSPTASPSATAPPPTSPTASSSASPSTSPSPQPSPSTSPKQSRSTSPRRSPRASPAASPAPVARAPRPPRLQSPLPSPAAALPDPGVFRPACQATPITCNTVVQGSTATAMPAAFYLGSYPWFGFPRQPGWPRQPGMPGQPYQPGTPNQPYQPGTPGEPYAPGQPLVPGQPYPPTIPGQPYQPGQPTQGCPDVSLDNPAIWYSLSLGGSAHVSVRNSFNDNAGIQIALFVGDCSSPVCFGSTAPAQQESGWQQVYAPAQGQVWLAVLSPQGSSGSYQLQISC